LEETSPLGMRTRFATRFSAGNDFFFFYTTLQGLGHDVWNPKATLNESPFAISHTSIENK
jgi:hypothetical protein